MATITPTLQPVGSTSLQGWQAVWTPLTFTGLDAGAPIGGQVNVAQNFGGGAQDLAGFSDRSIVVTGTFGAGGTVVWEGSNDGTNYVTLTDPQGNALSITSAGIKAVTEAVIFARPRVTAGDGTTSLTVSAFARRTFQQPGFPS